MHGCCVGSFETCGCECHRVEGMYHVMACCYPCPHCHHNIVPFAYDRHIETCKREQEERNKEIQAMLIKSGLFETKE